MTFLLPWSPAILLPPVAPKLSFSPHRELQTHSIPRKFPAVLVHVMQVLSKTNPPTQVQRKATENTLVTEAEKMPAQPFP